MLKLCCTLLCALNYIFLTTHTGSGYSCHVLNRSAPISLANIMKKRKPVKLALVSDPFIVIVIILVVTRQENNTFQPAQHH